ncbi:MAG: hypothetical protein AAF228_09870 [Pseudomonadota bacterium]
MSLQENHQVLPTEITDQMIAKLVSKSLHDEYKNTSAAVKHIGKKTGINLKSINNWYQGYNAPNAGHLLMLAKSYPQVLKNVLEVIDRTDVWEFCLTENIPAKMYHKTGGYKQEASIYSVKYDPTNLITSLKIDIKLNNRQVWFIGELRIRKNLKANDIVKQWSVSNATAKRDIAGLVDANLIHFVGAKKNGHYEVT